MRTAAYAAVPLSDPWQTRALPMDPLNKSPRTQYHPVRATAKPDIRHITRSGIVDRATIFADCPLTGVILPIFQLSCQFHGQLDF
ncbi:hypothetical protein SAMN06298226_1495 [Nitrosovibrio sp. Nv4]|nr:hypothetical protein SAMN06298226_1495 [Nitrosovibrio sp. Nv4]